MLSLVTRPLVSSFSSLVVSCNCCFVIHKISVDERFDETTHTVEFTNIKARGDVSSKVGFTYEKKTGQPYSALLETVKCLDKNGIDQIKDQANIKKELDEDIGIISKLLASYASHENIHINI